MKIGGNLTFTSNTWRYEMTRVNKLKHAYAHAHAHEQTHGENAKSREIERERKQFVMVFPSLSFRALHLFFKTIVVKTN